MKSLFKRVVLLLFLLPFLAFANDRPNILLIYVDDLRPELGCYGRSSIYSPHIDRLALTGQLFTQAYVNYPVCGPSRASLLSGLYPSSSRFIAWNCSQDRDVPGIVSLPMHFRNQGYYTISLGKVYNNYEDGKGSWNENWTSPTTTTKWDYQDRESIRIFEARNADQKTNLRPRTNNNLPKRGPAWERPDVADVTYEDGITATRAVEKLQEMSNRQSPFFMAVGFKKPHLPFNAPDKYWRIYDTLQITLPVNNTRPKDVPDAAMHNFSELRSYDGIPQEGDLSPELAMQLIRGYYACVSYVDAQIGRVLDGLEGLGLEKNTIVVLVGDHGWQLGEHSLWCKHANFKTSLHIPWIMRVPDQKGGQVFDGLVEAVDLYPTLCELAGLSVPFHTQGKSFAKMFSQESYKAKTHLFARSNLNGETILNDRYSYTEFFDNKGQLSGRMLFDLRLDPDETRNVVNDAKYIQVVQEMSALLRRHMEERDRVELVKK